MEPQKKEKHNINKKKKTKKKQTFEGEEKGLVA
jgi:hypothetical protein